MPSRVLKKFIENAKSFPDRISYTTEIKTDNGYESLELTYGDLDIYSARISGYLRNNLNSKKPVIVIGHKHPYLITSFVACSRSGRAYVPVDSGFPTARIKDIIEAVEPELIIITDNSICKDSLLLKNSAIQSIDIADIEKIISKECFKDDESTWVNGEDDYYIIFTSGSTGRPKGVRLTSNCLDNFIDWAVTLRKDGRLDDEKHRIYINQAPYSFDLSVFDLYTSLFTGGTIGAITKDMQSDSEELYGFLKRMNPNIWISTPSFSEIALMADIFNQELMPNIEEFIFCGETLTNKTAGKLINRFPRAIVVNTFGPTESTVAVTGIIIDEDIIEKYNPLPIGTPKQGTYIYIMDEDRNILNDGEKGEIVIVGDTVSSGYWNNEEKTREAFDSMTVDGIKYRLYHTRDKGYYKDGFLFYCGRLDLQIKLHGYRIEIEDIESNLLNVSDIEKAVVMPEYIDGEVNSLTAYVVPKNEVISTLKERRRIREELKKYIPEYMIPRKFVFRESLPVTANGKVDRKKLEAEL